MKSIKIIIVVSGMLILQSCSSTAKFSYDKYFSQVKESFISAVESFENKDYASAKNKFLEVIKEDSLYSQYESYAFLAETYKELGKTDSGKIVYDLAINSMQESLSKDKRKIRTIEAPLEDIRKWRSNYPKFPDELRKENGFIYDDTFPEIKGGIAAVQRHLIYPEAARQLGIQGTVLIAVLVNEKGNKLQYDVIKSPDEDLSKAALEALDNVFFIAPTRKGRKTKMWVAIPVKFQLNYN